MIDVKFRIFLEACWARVCFLKKRMEGSPRMHCGNQMCCEKVEMEIKRNDDKQQVWCTNKVFNETVRGW